MTSCLRRTRRTGSSLILGRAGRRVTRSRTAQGVYFRNGKVNGYEGGSGLAGIGRNTRYVEGFLSNTDAARFGSPGRTTHFTNVTSSLTMSSIWLRQAYGISLRPSPDRCGTFSRNDGYLRRARTSAQNAKRLYYLSMEFLIGRSLANNVTNLLLDPLVKEAVRHRRSRLD